MSSARSKWIFSYRRVGCRKLTEAERDEFRLLSRRSRWKAVWYGLVAFFDFLVAFTFFALGTDGVRLWWLAAAAAIVGFFWLLALAGRTESFALLCRRVARKGKLDRYEPADRPEGLTLLESDPEDEDDRPYPYWESDEKFEEKLVRLCGHRPAWFETSTEDDVLVAVEGQQVNTIHNMPAFFAESN